MRPIPLILILSSVCLGALAPFWIGGFLLMFIEVGATIGIMNGLLIQTQYNLWQRMTSTHRFLYLLSPAIMSLTYFQKRYESHINWRIAKRAVFNLVKGSLLVLLGVYLSFENSDFLPVAGGLIMWGLGLCFHLGLALLNSVFLEFIGFRTPILCDEPLKARSIRDFWSVRWNKAFSDFMRVVLLKPLGKRWGTSTVTFFIFILSGIIHELVITVPLGRLYGLPALYFIIQAIGMSVEKHVLEKSSRFMKLSWTYLILLGPILLLFPFPFLRMMAVETVSLITCILGVWA